MRTTLGMMRVHRRQFVLGPRPVDLIPGGVTAYVPDVGYLSHCPELRAASIQDAAGTAWHLLGIAVQTDTSRSEPGAELTTATPNSVEDTYHTWAGRWVLIGAGKLYLDVSGLLGCFYGFKDSTGGARELWVSSSLALLVTVLEVNLYPLRSIQHQKGMDWYAGPRSRFESIRQLLPSQILVLRSGEILPRQLLSRTTDHLSYDGLLDVLQKYLVAAVTQATKLSNNLRLPLTAGYDSRLLLATSRYAGIPITTYTHVHRHMSEADRLLPPQLAKTAGFRHLEHQGGQYSNDLAALYDRHTMGNCVDRDRQYISHRYFDWCRKGDLILRGGCFEIGRCHFWKKFRDVFPDTHTASILPGSEVILNGFKESTPHHSLVQTIDEWISWSNRTECEGLDWRDRLYLEQRLGCWLSAVEQSLDLIDADRFHAANSHFYFAHVLQIPVQTRSLGQHHIDLIKRMSPDLLQFPFNRLDEAVGAAPRTGPSRRAEPVYNVLRRIKQLLSKASR
jgi:hypothetical protein